MTNIGGGGGGDVDPKEINLNPRDPPYFYISTLQSSTASFHSCYANFTGSSDHNLVIKYS
jgi:hypothetical protein